jgi:Flp pilus assembly protein TadD
LAFHAATQRNPADAEAWLGSGVCRAALGDDTAARVDLERAAEHAPTRAEPLVALADVDVAQGDLAGALGRYRAAVLLDAGSATARVKLGNTLLRTGAPEQAAAAFRAAIERRPDLAAAHNGLGAALLAQSDLQGAETELKSAASLDPKDAHPLLNLARLYKRRGDSAAFADALAQAEARDPQLVVASSAGVRAPTSHAATATHH